MAGIAAAVATATKRRKSRCIHIGHLPFMSVARYSITSSATNCVELTRSLASPLAARAE
jgi:hypothetical protein